MLQFITAGKPEIILLNRLVTNRVDLSGVRSFSDFGLARMAMVDCLKSEDRGDLALEVAGEDSAIQMGPLRTRGGSMVHFGPRNGAFLRLQCDKLKALSMEVTGDTTLRCGKQSAKTMEHLVSVPLDIRGEERALALNFRVADGTELGGPSIPVENLIWVDPGSQTSTLSYIKVTSMGIPQFEEFEATENGIDFELRGAEHLMVNSLTVERTGVRLGLNGAVKSLRYRGRPVRGSTRERIQGFLQASWFAVIVGFVGVLLLMLEVKKLFRPSLGP